MHFSRLLALGISLGSLAVAAPAIAATFTVSTEAELRDAINQSNGTGVANTINVTAPITLTGFLPVLGTGATDNLTIDLGGHFISGGGVTRVFFANAGAVEIRNGGLVDGLAKGGDGGGDSQPSGDGFGTGGGGGLGAGGALFVRENAQVVLDLVSLGGNAARGGYGGSVSGGFIMGGGGGGMGGDGGTVDTNRPGGGGGGGGGGAFAPGHTTYDGSNNGGNGGGKQGGVGGSGAGNGDGGNGGDLSGGGGAGRATAGNPEPRAGNGGFGGGGGGHGVATAFPSGKTGGDGGYGGGGGGGAHSGVGAGNGGFGGGGGGGSRSGSDGPAGQGGFGGGTGADLGVGSHGGGGGAGFGGAIFVMQGGTLTLRGSGTMDGGAIAGGHGGRSTTGHAGGDGQAAGTGIFLQNASVVFDSLFGETQVIADTIADDFGNGSSAGGNVIKQGAGTLVLSGANSYVGPTRISGGTLVLNGSADRSLVHVEAGATLTGHGSALSGLVQPGATLAQDNTNGALSFFDTLVFQQGSQFRVGLTTAGAPDLIQAGNKVIIFGGTISISALDSRASYRDGQSFTLLRAENGVQGTFDEAVLSSAFLSSDLIYNPLSLELVVTQTGSFIDAATTVNQQAAATALSDFDQTSGSDALAVYNSFLALSADEAQAGYDQISGEVHAAEQTMVDQTFALFGNALGGSATGRRQVAPLPYGPQPGDAIASLLAIENAERDAPARSLWLTPLAGRGVVAADGNGAEQAWWGAGLAGGFESSTTVLGGTAQFGFGLGYLASGLTLDERLSKLEGQSGHLGLYGDWTDGALNIAGTLAYGLAHVESERHIVVGALDRIAAADYWTQGITASLEAGYDIALGNGLVVTPTGLVEAGWSHRDGFTESGAGALDATVAAASGWSLNTGLGAAISQSFALDDGGAVVLRGEALWMHTLDHDADESQLSLAGGGPVFTVSSAQPGRDQLRIGAGLDFQPIAGLGASLDYQGQVFGQQQSHAVQLGLKGQF